MDTEWTIPKVAVAVDLAILTVRSRALHVLLIERGIDPFVGELALPGGFLADDNEDLDAAARRELAEETRLSPASLHLEQLRTYGTPGRDPRERVITICYLALLPDLPAPTPGGDARGAHWITTDQILDGDRELAFDHATIVADAVEWARAKLEYTTLATTFCAPEFTVADLRQVYESIWRTQIDPRNFHRKVTGAPDFLIPIGRKSTTGAGRPAELYRAGTADVLYPPILRST